MSRPVGSRGRLYALVALLLGALLFVTACTDDGGKKNTGGSSGGSSSGGTGGPGRTGPVDPARVTITPADGTKGVEATAVVLVEIGPEDKLTEVVVTNNGTNQTVDGGLQPDGKTWKPQQPFSLGGKYTVKATATNANNEPTVATASFTTLSPDKKVIASFFPEDGQTVGVGQPISIRFDAPVKNKADVEKALKVTANPAVTGAWHWFGSQRVDFRPKDYWATNTEVKVDLNLRGIDLGDGAMSTQYKSFSFKISPDKIISKVDVKAKTMTVWKNDQVWKTIPITAGEEPKYATWNGVMVVQEKYTETRMNSQTVGLGNEYDLMVKWAVRTTTSGTFVHGNHWASADTFGKRNTSHGCVSMTLQNAKWFYDNAARPGDIVDVSGSVSETVKADNGYGAWNLNWDQWLSTSATGEMSA